MQMGDDSGSEDSEEHAHGLFSASGGDMQALNGAGSDSEEGEQAAPPQADAPAGT